jgi:hypothetical protein
MSDTVSSELKQKKEVGYHTVSLKDSTITEVREQLRYRSVADFVTKAIEEKLEREKPRQQESGQKGGETN